ncbi:phosphatase PAP2 family protein [bacterium]|nr:MAG: phosphatase PAP2 family protein [bacterium]
MASRRLVRAKRIFEGRHALGVAVGACGVAFGLGALIRYSFLQAVDLSVTRLLQREEWPPLDTAMVGFTNAGDPIVVPVLGGVAALALQQMALPRAARLVLMSLGSVPANIVMKNFWDRARPDRKLVNVAVETAGTSFPSGHTMGATALYGSLAALAWIHMDPRTIRLPLTLILVAIPIGVGISRVYLGAHWLSDVVAGYALGLFVLVPVVRHYLKGIPAEVEKEAATKGAPHETTGEVAAALGPTITNGPLALNPSPS